MAGDWIKMRVDLGTSPKVVRIASALRADRLRVIGGLHAVWCLFDVHSTDGRLDGYTLEALDDLIGFPGFGAAMLSVGWLEDDGASLCMPRFEEHNGKSAKRRAMETERKREARKLSASDADQKRTREEKRREEVNTKEPTVLVPDPSVREPVDAPDRLPSCPTDRLIELYHRHLPMLPRVEVMNDGRRRALSARWREVVTDKDIAKAPDPRQAALEFFDWYFEHAAQSAFLTGRAKNWRADFDFLTNASKFAKVVEGHYHKEAA
jgi:hypothetical protein